MITSPPDLGPDGPSNRRFNPSPADKPGGEVKENLERLRARIAQAARKGGREPSCVRLICVTKGVSVQRIEEAVACGVYDIGENRVQEANVKQMELNRQKLMWHMIGHLQRNKVKEALEIFDVIQSVDRPELAEAIQKAADGMKRSVEVLVEVNLSRIEGRSGVSPEKAGMLAEKVRGLNRLNLLGLMGMAPLVQDPEAARPHFRRLRELALGLGLNELSMGMSNDFEVAVEEGATMVRIGTAIFQEGRGAVGESRG